MSRRGRKAPPCHAGAPVAQVDEREEQNEEEYEQNPGLESTASITTVS